VSKVIYSTGMKREKWTRKGEKKQRNRRKTSESRKADKREIERKE
jgi:hypothetical protein